MTLKLTRAVARKVLETVDVGLCEGKGEPVPGKMCVEAAVCFALGLPHGDNPKCVGDAVRDYKIRLNDCGWSSNEARARGLRKIAIAQLGSNTIDQMKFAELVCFKGITKVLPVVFRAVSEHPDCPEKDKAQWLHHAATCEAAKTFSEAKRVSNDAYAYASASAYASAYASASAYAYAREFFTKKLGTDYLLNLSAEIALEALIELESPGCKWLDLCEEKSAA